MTEEAGFALTRDAFFGGRLVLKQPAKGHRAGMDAVLLVAAVPYDFAGRAYDAGAGVGTAGLGVASVCAAAHIGLIERDPLAATLARENVTDNGLAARAAVHTCDLLCADSRAHHGVRSDADLVISNPPFYEPGSVRVSPDARRQAAHVNEAGGTMAWVAACLALLGARGTLILIHRPEALRLLLEALEGRAGAVTLKPIYTAPGAAAKRLLLRAVKGSRAPLTLRPGFTVNDAVGTTPEADRIYRGNAHLEW